MSESHDDVKALAPGYVLGILDTEELRTFEPHLEECPECAAEVRALSGAVDTLARSVPTRTPPAALRRRVLASLNAPTLPLVQRSAPPANSKAARRVGLPVAASVLIALGAGIYGSHLHVESRLAALSERAEASDRDIAAARRAAADTRSAMEVIAAPDVIRIDLKPESPAVAATARALWSREHGMVFAGTNIPPPPAGRCYQVWLVTSRGTISAGILPEPGNGLAVFATPPDVSQLHRVAVTLEAVGGVVTPTGTEILAGQPSA